jgi:hypothetical protein
LNDLPEKRVGREEHVVVEEDVIDANDALFAQDDVRFLRVAPVHREAETEMRVVIEIRAGRDDPIDEPALDQRNERRHAQAGGRERTGQRHADSDVRLEHFFREQPTGFAKPRGVVREKRVVDQIGGRLGAGDRPRLNAIAAKKLALRVRCRLRCGSAGALPLLGGVFLLCVRARVVALGRLGSGFFLFGIG